MKVFTFAVISFAVILAASADRSSIPHNDFYTETQECIPKTMFIDECNICQCGLSGKIAACTKIGCDAPEKPHIDGYKDGFSCPPGKTFYDGCNECVCNKSGKAAECTATKDCKDDVTSRSRRSVARSNIPHIDNFAESGECTPGQAFYLECNTCVCSLDGKSAGCTRMACIDYNKIRIDNYEQGNKCPAGKTFYDKCNTCNCSNDGLSVACTRALCPDFE